jgi:tetratricopeptide (TPR) repeat protein
MFYPESWLAVHYLMRDPARTKQFAAFLKAERAGEPTEAAFTRCFQTDPAGFQKALERYLDKATFSRAKLDLPPAPEVRVAPLPPSADRLLLLAAHIRKGAANAQDREKVLAAARAGAEAFPDDPLALRTLAEAEMKFGDLDKADAPLDRLLAAHPDDVEAHYLKGRRWMMAGRRDPEHRTELWDKARTAFAAAYQLDHNYYPAIFFSGLSRADEPGPPSDNTINVLLDAHDLAPQVDEISFTAARVLMRRERYAEVVALLEPIAYAPHPGQWSQRAQAMLETAREHLSAPGPAAAPAAAAPPEH